MEDTGARLVIVLGHTECAAVDRAIDRWLDKTAWTWPWLSQTTSLHYPPNWQPVQSLGPPKPPSASTSTSSSTPEDATRSDKLNLTGIKACTLHVALESFLPNMGLLGCLAAANSICCGHWRLSVRTEAGDIATAFTYEDVPPQAFVDLCKVVSSCTCHSAHAQSPPSH